MFLACTVLVLVLGFSKSICKQITNESLFFFLSKSAYLFLKRAMGSYNALFGAVLNSNTEIR